MAKVQAPSDISKEATRAVSKLLHGGARYRVEIGAMIAANATIDTGGIAEELGLSRQLVNQELHALERAGLIERVSPVASDRKVYFSRHDSAYWSWCVEAVTEAERMLKRAPRY